MNCHKPAQRFYYLQRHTGSLLTKAEAWQTIYIILLNKITENMDLWQRKQQIKW